ncbi:hypothetical protein E1630_23125 [Salmonella enterica subsp. enterica serovar Baguida]|nr:hypothetical protein [Salmonella enterica subsp. enterica serovar Baguida]ELC6656714.1 hypothetical protein [Salmonella enterica]EMA5682142.1 hypothetical protein [Salmonella enterica]EMA5837626.1 hypothetical protein [Salmonella enterica]EMA6041743.1 hypothetical protein [Salmonella enterica]
MAHPDPIGLRGGVNPYSYVKNPLKWIDPLGLCKDEVVNLYRAIGPDELSQILETNTFKNPYGIEGKYFTSSLEKAKDYAKMAENSFKDPPYSFVRTEIPKNVLDNPAYYAEVDGGIPAYVLPDDVLSGLEPYILNDLP